MHRYIMYCKGCQIVKIDESNLECKQCLNKMEDIGFVESVEEAIWWGQKHPEAAVDRGPIYNAWLKEIEEENKIKFENAVDNNEWESW